jgi:hypothetical protein
MCMFSLVFRVFVVRHEICAPCVPSALGILPICQRRKRNIEREKLPLSKCNGL